MTARARSRPARAGVVIAGGGLASQRACEALRHIGYDGPIRMIAAELHQPYDRPPLSKDYLAGTLDEAALPLRPRDWYADHDDDLLLGQRAVRLDPLARTVTTPHGASSASKRNPRVAVGGATAGGLEVAPVVTGWYTRSC